MKFHLDLHEDVMTIGGISIPKQRFGIAKPHEGDIGAFSIGPDRDLGYEAGKPFNSVLDNLAAQKAIASRTYSLDLRDFDDPKGRQRWNLASAYHIDLANSWPPLRRCQYWSVRGQTCQATFGEG